MPGRPAIGFVAAGKRARTLMEHLYTIRDQEYFLCDREDGWPHGFYAEYAAETPEWVDDVSDLQPSITAIMNPGTESRETAAGLCRNRGDDPALYGDFEAFLDDGEFDAVVVASPNDKHVESVVPLLERDVDTFCEKPLATTLPAHDELIEAAAATDALFYVGFQRRVAPYYRTIKDLLAAGTVGDLGMVSHVEVRDPFQSSSGGFRFSEERSGGALLEKNSHDFDLFNWYTEAEPVRVSAFGGQHVFTRETDIVDQATVNVHYDDGTVGSLELCLYNGVGHADVYDVHTRKTSEYRGTDGVIIAPDSPEELLVQKRGETEEITVGAVGSHGGDVYQMRRFLRCLQGTADPPATAVDAKKAAAVSLAAERSIERDGAVVEIDGNYDLV